ncbi:MAG: endolytic transglycosylase MltG [Chitinispirillia bacterium]|nr:endolytic transglycosylase MltG [Chitinispirillia bacterium]MCL2242442.1 endolytic transglycosylase MltG [Chitinispirillia bacterium]
MMKKLFIAVCVLFLLLLAALGGAVWAFNHYLMPMKSEAERVAVPVMVERGTSAQAVANILEEREVVRSSKALYLWMRHKKTTDKVQAGRFTFVKGEGAIAAAERLLKAEVDDKAMIILEGLAMEQIAGRVAAQTGVDSAEFVRLCNDANFIATLGIESPPTLEGYLFPDTYRLPENSTEATIIRRMVARFNEALATVEWSPAIKEKYGRHQVLTLASIVEKEATLPSERGKIAGVFHNRLRLGWPLGADPTVRYIYRKFSGPLRVSELNSSSPYNTRRFAGLPPGPICSPGLGAIKASANPETTDAMFFVAFRDGSGAHDFSVTNAEHDRKKNAIRKERGIAE